LALNSWRRRRAAAQCDKADNELDYYCNNALGRGLTSVLMADHSVCSTRRGMLIAPLLAALPLAMLGATARAGQINPAETAITLPDLLSGPHSGEMSTLYAHRFIVVDDIDNRLFTACKAAWGSRTPVHDASS